MSLFILIWAVYPRLTLILKKPLGNLKQNIKKVIYGSCSCTFNFDDVFCENLIHEAPKM